MNMRLAIFGTAAALALASAGAAAWWMSGGDDTIQAAEPDAPLPLPPVPPRIAQGEQYDQCLKMLSDDPAGASAYAEGWQAAGGGEPAAHCVALARMALGEPETGAQMLQSLADSSTSPNVARASLYDQAGQAWMMAGNVDNAFAALTMALVLDPDDPDMLVDRAVAAGNLGNYQAALDDLTHALDLDPHRVDAMVLRGSAWRHLGRLELAQDDIDRALLADPDNAEALLERGILKQRRDDRTGARTDWERAMTLAPDSATADLAQQNLALLEAGPERK